jgi:hypothetical protein
VRGARNAARAPILADDFTQPEQFPKLIQFIDAFNKTGLARDVKEKTYGCTKFRRDLGWGFERW